MISPPDRRKACALITAAHRAGARLEQACECLGLGFKTYQRWQQDPEREDRRTKAARAQAAPRPRSKRALSEAERQKIASRFCSADVVDLSLPQAFYVLLDRGEYYGSLRTIYRVMEEQKLNAPRGRARAPHRAHRPSSFEATGPGQVWTWDITYLRNAKATGEFFYAYVIVDIFTRKIVHQAVYDADNETYAKEFLEKVFRQRGIKPRQQVLHSDNGAAMKAAGTLGVLAAYRVLASRSRPRVSNDNPYSESFFRTLKYTGRASYPIGGFHSLQEARDWLAHYVADYNGKRYLSGINYITPNDRDNGKEANILARRQKVIADARARHPERWIQNRILNCSPAGSVWLNPEKEISQEK